MKFVLIGATGFVGKAIAKEASDRGHEVTAVARNIENVPDLAGVKWVQADVFKQSELSDIIKGHDGVISAYNPGWHNPSIYNDFLKGSEAIQTATFTAGVRRLLVIGGAGSLYINGKQLVDSAGFPKEWLPGAKAARDYLNILKEEQQLDWTFLSPAIELVPGERTGQFKLADESPVFDHTGRSYISVQDLAVAALNEMEKADYIRKRFTLGYP